VNVIRLSKLPNHNAIFVFGFFHFDDGIGIKINLSDRRAGRGIDARGKRFDLLEGFGVELGMQQSIDLFRRNPLQSRFFIDQPFVYHLYRNGNFRPCGAFSVPSLQHPEFTAFDGKFHILHIPIVLFQPAGDIHKLGVNIRHNRLKCFQRLCISDSGYDIFTLSI